ncbi:hypothetical protein [Dyella sp.]|uniref:hypothetical protein n=1 Tax=Dyella sp. TaxID=1869338 RepID=UPI002B474983|nr:hypothetical protein [Dyella sp.]HKT29210.1 hypothetical protein [Dyella sp.]
MKAPDYLRTGLRKKLTVAVVILAGSLTTVTNMAQGVQIVNDPMSLARAIEEYAQQESRWIQTAQHYMDQIQHYKDVMQHYADQAAFWQQQLVKLQGLNFQLFTLQNQFTHIPDDYGVSDACPGITTSLAGDITSALQSFIPQMGGDVVKQQRQLCGLIVMTKNKKYNDTVDYLQAVARASSDLTQIQEERFTKVDNSSGNLDANTNDIGRYQGNLTQAREQWQSNMQQNDAQVQMLQQIQSNLSRRAMQGSPSVLGTIINSTALKAALSN